MGASALSLKDGRAGSAQGPLPPQACSHQLPGGSSRALFTSSSVGQVCRAPTSDPDGWGAADPLPGHRLAGCRQLDWNLGTETHCCLLVVTYNQGAEFRDHPVQKGFKVFCFFSRNLLSHQMMPSQTMLLEWSLKELVSLCGVAGGHPGPIPSCFLSMDSAAGRGLALGLPASVVRAIPRTLKGGSRMLLGPWPQCPVPMLHGGP